MCGYGDEASLTASRSKKRALGSRQLRKEWRPVRCCGSFGRNQAAETGMIRGFELVDDCRRASASSIGVIKYELKHRGERLAIMRLS